tara:strand:- start:1852 stop:2028 length:177 start_codon:yes stop_codon:yes gene_type:complete
MEKVIKLTRQELININGGTTIPYTGGTFSGFYQLGQGFIEGFGDAWNAFWGQDNLKVR